MDSSICIKCFMVAMQKLFVAIRSSGVTDDFYIELLDTFRNYIDVIPDMKPKDIANLKNEIRDMITANEVTKEYIIDNLKELIKQEQYERVHDLADAVHNYL